MTKYNTINRYLFVFMAIMLLAASMLFGANANLKLHAEEEITDLRNTVWQLNSTIENGNGESPIFYVEGEILSDYYAKEERDNPLSSIRYLYSGNALHIRVHSGESGGEKVVIIAMGDGNGSALTWAGDPELPVTIKITGGADAVYDESNNFTAFKNWLQANATLVPAEEPSTGVVENISLSVVMIISLVAVLTITTILNKKSKVIR